MNKTVVSFSVIKEKIIKTDEVLQMYKDTNTKLQKSQIICKEWKSKYENVSCGQERLELENYRINDSLKQLEDEHKHIVSQNEDLIRQLRKLEEQYNILSVSSQSSIKELQDELQISQELNNHCNTENSKKTFEETENKLMVEIDALKAKNNELSKKIAEMVIKSADSESLRTENSTLLGSIKILQQTVESSEAKAKKVDEKDQEIKKLLGDLTDIKSKLENMQLDNSTLMRRIHEKDEELKKVKCKIVQESSTQTDEEISCNQAESRELEFEKSKISITGTKTRSDTDNKKSSLCTAFSQKSTVLDSDTEPIEYIFRDMLKLPKMISPIRSPALPNITLMAPTPPIENVQPADDFVVPSKTVRKHFPISAKKRRKKYKLSYISQDSQNIKQKQINKQIMHKKLLRRKMLRRIHMNKDSNLIDALRLLKKSNINFIIYNEPSESLKNPIYNSENHPHQHPQPQQYNTAVKIEPCLLRNCKSRPCHLMLNQTKEMLGFFNIKNEDTAAAHISTESIAKCESLSNLTTTYLDTIVERVIEKIEERGVMHHKRRMRNRRSDSFHSGTETEIEMCFQTSKADILERNKMLLEKAKYENANREENLLLNNSLTDDCTKDSGLSSSALERLSQSSLVTNTPHDATIQKIFLQYPMCPIVTPVKEAEAGNNSINKYLREHDSTMDTLNISNVELSQFLNLSELDISRKDNWFGITPTEEELIHIKNLTKSTAIPEGSKVPRKLFSDNLAKLTPNTIQSTELCPSVKCEVDEKMHDCQRKTIDCLKSPELCGTDKSDISTAKFIASTAQLQSQQKWLEDQNNLTNERIILVEPSIVIHKESSIHQLMEKCPEETIKTTKVKISDCTNINDSPKSPNIKVCPSETKISKKGIFNIFSQPTLAKHSENVPRIKRLSENSYHKDEKVSKISLHLDNVPNIKNVSESFQSSYLYDNGTTSKSELLCMDIVSDSPMSPKSNLNELDIKNVLLESAQYKLAIDKKTETVTISETIYDSPMSPETTSNSQLLCMDIVSNNPMSSKLEDIDIKNVLLESSQSKVALDKKTETVAVSETIYDSPMSPETTSNNQLLCMDIVSNNPMSSKLEDIDIKKVVMDKKSESVAVSYTIYESAMSPETTSKSRLLCMDIVSDSPMSPVSKLDNLNIKNVLLESSQSKVVMDKKSESVAVTETIHDSPMSPETDVDSRNEAVSKSKLDLPSDADLCKMANVKNESNSNRSEDEALIKNQLLAVPFIIPDNSFSTQSKLGNIIKMEKVSESFQSEAEMVRSRSAAMSGLISENLLSPEADLNSTKNSSNSHLNKNQQLAVSNFLPNSPLSPESNLTNAPNIENVLECFRSKYEMVGGQPIAVSSLVLDSHLSPEADFDKMKIGSSSYHSEDEAVSKNNPMSVSDILPDSPLSPEADFDKMKIGSSSYHSEDEAVGKNNPMSVSDILPDSPLSPEADFDKMKIGSSSYHREDEVVSKNNPMSVSDILPDSPLSPEADFNKMKIGSSSYHSEDEAVSKNNPMSVSDILPDSPLSPEADFDKTKIESSSYHSEDEAVSKNNPMSVSDILPDRPLSPEADFDKTKIGSSSYHSEDEAVSKNNPMSVSDILPDSPLSPESNLGYVPKKIESKDEMFRSQSVTVSRLVSNSPLASEANFDKKNSSSSNLSAGKNQSTLPGIVSDSTLSPKSDIDFIPKIKNISENSSGKNFDSPLSPKSHFNNLSNNENVYCQTKDKPGKRSLLVTLSSLVSNNLQSLKRSDLRGKYQNKDKLPLSSKPFTKIDQSEMCFIEENASNPSNDIDKPEIPLAPVSSLKSDLTKEILSYLGTNTPTLSAPELETATNTSDKLITSSNEPLKHFDSGRRSKRLSQKLKCCSESVNNTKCYSFIDNINFDKKDNTCLPDASKPKCKEDEYVVKVLEPIKRKRGRPRAIVENRDLHIERGRPLEIVEHRDLHVETKSEKTDGDNKQEEIISTKRPKIVISKLKSQIMRQLKVKRIMLRTEKDTVAIATSGTVNKPVKTNVICGTQTIPNKRKAIQNQNSEGNRKIKIMQNIVIKPGITSKEGLLNQQLIRSDLTTTIVSANQKECIGNGVKTILLNKEKTRENCDKQDDILSRILTDMGKEKSSPVRKPLPQKHVNVTNSIGSEVWRTNLLDIAEIIHFPDYGDIGRDIFERSNNTPCSSLKNKNLNRKSKLLAKRLLQTTTENDVPDNIILEFKRLEVDVIVELILHIVSKSEKEVPNPEYFPAPLMTRTQRILLTLMVRLQNENVGNIMDSFLGKAQQIVLRAGCGTQKLISITRLYVAICRLRADIYRIRLYCCEAFYRIGSLAVPLLFTVLTSWSEVFPHEKDLKNYPMAKLIVQIIDLKKYTLHDHHLIMLKSLLQQFYGYPSNRWDCDILFDELTQQYLRSPTTSSGFSLKLFCKYKDTQWVINKIETFFKPLIYKIPSENVNLKATVILLLGYICKQFNRNKEVEEKYLLDIERWFLGIIEDNPPELVKQSVQIILDILGKRKKKTHKTGINRRKHFKKIPMKNQKFINKNKKSNKKFSRKFVGQNKIS